MSQYEFGNYQQDALTKPRDKAWDNWAKFENVGDLVQGFIRDVFFREGEGDFKEQRGITLETPTGELINVGIKQIDFVLAKTDHLRLGDPLTIVFEKEIPPSVKGYSPTKQFGFYGKNLDENKGNKTVKELEADDKEGAAAEVARQNAEFDGTAEPVKSTDSDLPFEKGEAAGGNTAAPVATPAPTVAPAAVDATPAVQ